MEKAQKEIKHLRNAVTSHQPEVLYMLASIGLSVRNPLPYMPPNPSIPSAALHAFDIAGALARGVLPPLPDEVGGVRDGDGVGDCTKHHCFTNAAYEESVVNGDEEPSFGSEGTGRAE